MIKAIILISLLIVFYISIYLYEKKGMFKKFFHDCLFWHKPEGGIYFDGVNAHSICRYCGKEILQDSRGDWFSIGD